MDITITVTKTIEDQIIRDQIITALEGGSNYWYYLKDLSMLPAKKEGEALSERICRAVLDEGISVPVYDIEDPDGVSIGAIETDLIRRGLETMAIDYKSQFNDMLDEVGDADTADVFLQLVVMGDIIFG